ncbi:MAG: hypothetical protein R3B96_10665 [Pirellulaceae bacterium]
MNSCNGYLGAIKEVHVGIAASNHPFRNREPIADSDPPAELNYDMWLGQAPWRPYNELHVHYNSGSSGITPVVR